MMQQPKKLVVGNWKMNGTRSSSSSWAKGILRLVETKTPECEIAVSPPTPFLEVLVRELGGTRLIGLCGQDCASQEKGAHTGDVSAAMLAEVGCSYVLVGHSERRTNHAETSSLVRDKAAMALSQGLMPIICVGETEAERETGRAIAVVKTQVSRSLPELATGKNVIIAYEPVWAIGTGQVPNSHEISEMHNSIRENLRRRLKAEANLVPLLYGGSVRASNAKEIIGLQNVDGVLVGGASLKFEEFWNICVAYGNLKRDASGTRK